MMTLFILSKHKLKLEIEFHRVAAKVNEQYTVVARSKIGTTVEQYPTAKPMITDGPAPILVASANEITGLN